MSDVFPQPELRQLLAEIEAAFGDVRLGGGVSLHQARAIDDFHLGLGGPDFAAARRLDAEERWQDIPDGKVENLSDTLVFMDAEGFRFHMPRFMVYMLTHAGGSPRRGRRTRLSTPACTGTTRRGGTRSCRRSSAASSPGSCAWSPPTMTTSPTRRTWPWTSSGANTRPTPKSDRPMNGLR